MAASKIRLMLNKSSWPLGAFGVCSTWFFSLSEVAHLGVSYPASGEGRGNKSLSL